MSHRKILKSGFFPESKFYEFSLFPGPQSSNQTVSYQYHSLSLKYPVKSNQQSKLNHTLKKRFLKRTNWFSVSQKDTVDTSSTAVYYQLIKLDDHRKDTENYDEMLKKAMWSLWKILFLEIELLILGDTHECAFCLAMTMID